MITVSASPNCVVFHVQALYVLKAVCGEQSGESNDPCLCAWNGSEQHVMYCHSLRAMHVTNQDYTQGPKQQRHRKTPENNDDDAEGLQYLIWSI
jgi:hypothetical protein